MKKILLVNDYSIKNEDAVGITIRSIFCDSTSEYEIFDLFKTEKKKKKNIKVESYKINSKVLPVDSLLRIMSKKSSLDIGNESLATVSGKKNVKSILKENIKFLAESIIFKDREELKKIKDFNPDYIYTIGGSVFSLKHSLYLSEKLKIPIVLHYMDNWRESIYQSNLITSRALKNLINKVEEHSTSIITISEKMLEEYSTSKTMHKYYCLMNTIDTKNTIKKDTNKPKTKLTNLVFIGGVHLERWKVLKIVTDILEKNKLNENYRLLVYSNSPKTEEYESIFENKIAIDMGFLPHEKLDIAYENSDILLHVESFSNSIINYTKYSMSTKISEYMISDCPFIYYGPKGLSVAKYISENNIAFSCSNESELLTALHDIESKNKELNIHKLNSIKLAESKHSIEYRNKILLKIFK